MIYKIKNQTEFPEKITHQVTPDMVRARTVELANHAGRHAHEILQTDYERAKRELTGETNHARQQAVIYPIQ